MGFEQKCSKKKINSIYKITRPIAKSKFCQAPKVTMRTAEYHFRLHFTSNHDKKYNSTKHLKGLQFFIYEDVY